jgi:hypothetical protein
MYIQYGNYQHESGEVEVSVEQQLLETEQGRPYAHNVRWLLQGTLLADNSAEMDRKVLALVEAYKKHGQDISLRFTTGKETHLALYNRHTITGVKVVQPPSFPGMRHAAYVTYLPYTIVLEAEVPLAGASTVLLSFTESVSRSGGGAQKVVLEPLETPPVFQLGRRFSAYRAVQSGTAVGYLRYPFAPSPLWPQWLLKRPDSEQRSPRQRGNGKTEFPISWRYEFASPVPLFGRPHSIGI